MKVPEQEHSQGLFAKDEEHCHSGCFLLYGKCRKQRPRLAVPPTIALPWSRRFEKVKRVVEHPNVTQAVATPPARALQTWPGQWLDSRQP